MASATEISLVMNSFVEALRAQLPKLKNTQISLPTLWPSQQTHGDILFSALLKSKNNFLIVVSIPNETASKLANHIARQKKADFKEGETPFPLLESLFFDSLTKITQAFEESEMPIEIISFSPLQMGNSIVNIFPNSQTLKVDFATYWKPISVFFNFANPNTKSPRIHNAA